MALDVDPAGWPKESKAPTKQDTAHVGQARADLSSAFLLYTASVYGSTQRFRTPRHCYLGRSSQQENSTREEAAPERAVLQNITEQPGGNL